MNSTHARGAFETTTEPRATLEMSRLIFREFYDFAAKPRGAARRSEAMLWPFYLCPPVFLSFKKRRIRVDSGTRKIIFGAQENMSTQQGVRSLPQEALLRFASS